MQAVRRPAKKMSVFCLSHGHFAACEACVIFRNKSASFNSQFEQQHLVQHASSTREYCRSQRLLFFAPNPSTRVQKLMEIRFFSRSTPFFVGWGTRLPLKLLIHFNSFLLMPSCVAILTLCLLTTKPCSKFCSKLVLSCSKLVVS